MSGGLVPADDLPANIVPASDLPGSRTIVEPNPEQRRMGLRKNRYKDEDLGTKIGKGFLSFPEDFGRETVLAAHDWGASPGVANAAGFAADMGANLIPVIPGGQVAAKVAAPALESLAKFTMQGALRPTSKALNNGTAAKAIDTMLEEGISATASGAAKLRQKITELKGQVGKVISDNAGSLADKSYVYKELQSLLDEIAPLGERGAASKESVLKAWEQFKNHPFARGETTPIPLEQADTIKRAFQKESRSAYGGPTGQPIDARIDMATAAGMRKATEAAAPAIAPINAKLSGYINALNQLEPRAASIANQQLGGMVPLTHSPEAAMLMLADRNPWMKSLIARVLYSGREAIPAAAAEGLVGTATAVNAATRKEGR